MSVNFSTITSSTLKEFNKTKRNDELSTKRDYRSDFTLISAKGEFATAQADENKKAQSQKEAEMSAAHIANNGQELVNEYQYHQQQLTMATLSANEVAGLLGTNANELGTCTNNIRNLEAEKTTTEKNITDKANEISSLKLEKAGQLSSLRAAKETAVAAHDNRISSLTSRKDNLATSNSSKRSSIASLRASITEETDEATKTSIESQISQLESEISANESEISRCEQEITEERAAKERTIANYDKQISDTEARFNQLIQNAEGELAQLQTDLGITTGNLAQANFVQAGLTMQRTTLETQHAAATAYLAKEQQMIANIEQQMAENEAKETENNKKVEKATKETTVAKENTDAKKAAYVQTENEVKEKYELNLMF